MHFERKFSQTFEKHKLYLEQDRVHVEDLFKLEWL